MECSRRRILGLGSTVVSMAAVLLCLILTTSPGVSAQAPSPAMAAGGPSPMSESPMGESPMSESPMSESPDCFTSILNMSDCLTYVEAGSNLTTPEKGCCPSLAGLVESTPICLCQFLGNSSSYGIQIDVKRALNLPKVCRVDTPSVSLCAAFGVPVGVPTASQGPISPGRGPVGSMGQESMPPSPDGSNGSSSTPNSVLVFVVGLSSLIIAIVF
ncbi:Twin-arginine translocation pathway [Macleaya cordata]|uniref:Twin-arginine translocation pathway n=1 Tax=Macleaya cordata TaxID=56857 RepID=A0A200Q0C7_MACCD|nr:Twin-arginine translocation pathway [Macleaya cordata]